MIFKQEDWIKDLDKLVAETPSFTPIKVFVDSIKLFISDLLNKESSTYQNISNHVEKIARESGHEQGYETGRGSLKQELLFKIKEMKKSTDNMQHNLKGNCNFQYNAAVYDVLSLLNQIK